LETKKSRSKNETGGQITQNCFVFNQNRTTRIWMYLSTF